MDINRNGHSMPSGQLNNQQSRPAGPRQRSKWHRVMRVSSLILLFSSTILVVALLLSFVFTSGNRRQESRFVDTEKYQAVFLINQQLPYFAKITEMNSRYLAIEDIYYLSVNQQVQPKTDNDKQQQDIQLIKLGCELHGPQDRMIINKDQVVFWENLENNGKVAEAISRFKAQNPNGLQCKEAPQNQE